ncbi:hypothetical protein Bca52824_090418 [Brassica carinata]|uniref:Uncharacterized protein n=1 Tax=Brassica carinata TaxID=52824 RepID=A0A8X7TI58_BRACI|nr:hypothetical protein Bca52824_090418 [Brassica carinata]
MDPAREKRDKEATELINMQGYAAIQNTDSTRCPSEGESLTMFGKDDYDTLPRSGSSPQNYKADGFHYRQPWVIGVQEHIERLTKRLEEVELVINWVPEVNNQIERLEAEVKALNGEVDNLTGQVYNLSVQVADLEKLCFD